MKMSNNLDYTFFHADGNTICVATEDVTGESFGATVPTSEFPCSDHFRLIAMIGDEVRKRNEHNKKVDALAMEGEHNAQYPSGLYNSNI